MSNIWPQIREEALEASRQEPILASFFHASIINHKSLAEALTFHLAGVLDSAALPATLVREVCDQATRADPGIVEAAAADIEAYYDRDPACDRYVVPLLYYKGYQAIQAHRVAHWLYQRQRTSFALYIQNQVATRFSVDIHPAARLGKGLMLDHATGLVVGETAVIGDSVSMLHGVTLGGCGLSTGDRHPKVRDGVLLSAGAKLLGNIEVGAGARIAAGSVVLSDVPPNATAAGVPAKIVGQAGKKPAALDMDQRFDQGVSD